MPARCNRFRSATCLIVALGTCAIAGESPQPPAITSVVPVEDLMALVESYRKGLGEMTADEQTFLDSAHKVSRDAQTLAAVGLALGIDETDHPLKTAAPAVIAAARQLAQAKDFAAAHEAIGALERAFDEKPAAAQPLKPEKVASLAQLMKQAGFAQNRLKRGPGRTADDNEAKRRDAALLAAIAQALLYDTELAQTPDEREQWYRFCGQMRNRAGRLNRALKAADKEGTEHTLREVGQSCEACHAAFR